MKKQITPIFFDTPEEVLNSYNCVYKITTADGHYKIGYTTLAIRDRIKQYFAASSKENICQIVKKNRNIKVEILDKSDDVEVLTVLEQLHIQKEAKQIFANNGFAQYLKRPFVGNDIFTYDCVQKSLLLNKKLDKVQHLIDYYNGEYDDYFKVYPFDDNIVVQLDSMVVSASH